MLKPGALRVLFSGAFLSAFALVACGGGGGSTPPVITVPPPTGLSVPGVALVLKLPKPPSGSAVRPRPNYISAGTESIGVVVTNQGESPSPAVYLNISSCTVVSGVTTCTITVQAVAGSDTFTITAYSGQNGTGSVLSTGTFTLTISFGGAPPTVPVTLGGVVGSIAISTVDANLPLSQSMSVNVVAKDATGATIVGTYDSPIVLSGGNLVISQTSLADSAAASNVSVSWPQSYTGSSPATLTATGDGTSGTLTVTPASGFAYYTTGTNSATDWSGFKMILGPDGNLYYTSIGQGTELPSGYVVSSAGAVHRFSPTAFTDTEVALPTEGIGMAFDSTGALWVAGGLNPVPTASPSIYRIASATTSFSAANLLPITVTGTGASLSGVSTIRAVTQDGASNMWFSDLQSERLISIPVEGPFTTTGMTVLTSTPPPPAVVPFGYGARTLNYLSASNTLVAGMTGGYVETYNLTGGTFATVATNLQTSLNAIDPATISNLYDAATDGTNVFVGQVGNINGAFQVGDLEKFSGGTNLFTTLSTVSGPTNVDPSIPAYGDGLVYYGDLGLGALGYVNPTSGATRAYPIQLGGSYFYGPDGLAVLADGTAWFTCYGNNDSFAVGFTVTFQPICVGHTIYTSTWGLWPGATFSINGAGAQGAQVVGIMEAPGVNSAPFTVTSNTTGICTVTAPTAPSDHNFTVTGVGPGSCSVSVKDRSGNTQAMNITVTTTSGTVQLRHRAKLEVR